MTAVISNIRVLFVEISSLEKGKLAQQNPITLSSTSIKCVVGAIQTGIAIMTIISIFKFVASLATKTAKTIQKGCNVVKTWLYTKHNYSNEEGDIYMTGWQALEFGLLVSAVTIVFSMRF